MTWKERGRALWRAVPALLSPVILLSGILLGIFSATEASVVCCLYSLFLGIFIYKELSPKGLYNVFLDTLKSSGMVMALVTFSMLLATILNYNQIPQAVAAWAVTHITSKVGIILACMVLIIIAGMVIDGLHQDACHAHRQEHDSVYHHVHGARLLLHDVPADLHVPAGADSIMPGLGSLHRQRPQLLFG